MNELLHATSLYDVLHDSSDRENYEALKNAIITGLPEKDAREIRQVLSGESLPSLMSDVIAKKIFSPTEHPLRAEYLLQKVTNDMNIHILGDAANEGYMQGRLSKKMIFDIPVRLLDERRADIEFQISAQDFIIERAELYSSDLLLVEYSTAIDQKKEDLSFTDVHGTIIIVFMRKSPNPFKAYQGERYIHRFDTMESDSGIKHTPLRKMYFVQVDKAFEQFLRGEDAENDKEFQLLLAAMADINNEQVRKEAMSHPELAQIYDELRVFAQDKEVQNMLLSEKYAVADFNAVKSYERNEGLAEGLAKGLAKGHAEGGQEMIYRLVSEKEITPEKGAMTLEISVEDLKNRMILLGYDFPEE